MSRRLLVAVVSIAVVLTIAVLAFTVARKTYKRTRPVSWAERQAQEVLSEFPALSEAEAAAHLSELSRVQTRDDFDATLSHRRREYISRMIRRKIAGEPIDQQHYRRLLATITQYPADVATADLRALLNSTSEREDHETYIACLRIMGASGNEEFISDVRSHLPNYRSLEPYALLARSEAIPELIRYVDLGPGLRNSGPQDLLQEEAIEALGATGDPDVLPILNDIGERQQVHRKAVERALGGIDHPAAVTVAVNMLSLPTDYPNKHLEDEGRWHSNEHLAARNVVLKGAERYGVPPPPTVSQRDLKLWWHTNRSKFPSLDEIRASFPEQRHKFLRSPERE